MILDGPGGFERRKPDGFAGVISFGQRKDGRRPCQAADAWSSRQHLGQALGPCQRTRLSPITTVSMVMVSIRAPSPASRKVRRASIRGLGRLAGRWSHDLGGHSSLVHTTWYNPGELNIVEGLVPPSVIVPRAGDPIVQALKLRADSPGPRLREIPARRRPSYSFGAGLRLLVNAH